MSMQRLESYRQQAVRTRPYPDAWVRVHIRTAPEISPILDAITAALAAEGYPENDVFGMRLALEEAIVNAIKHGHRNDPSLQVRVSYRVNFRRAVVQIEDEGPGFDPHQVADPLCRRKPRPPLRPRPAAHAALRHVAPLQRARQLRGAVQVSFEPVNVPRTRGRRTSWDRRRRGESKHARSDQVRGPFPGLLLVPQELPALLPPAGLEIQRRKLERLSAPGARKPQAGFPKHSPAGPTRVSQPQGAAGRSAPLLSSSHFVSHFTADETRRGRFSRGWTAFRDAV